MGKLKVIFLLMVLMLIKVGGLSAQFTPASEIAIPNVRTMQWGDWNGDGLPDLLLAAANTSGEVALLLYTAGPDSLVQTHVFYPTYSQVYSLQWDDMDRDGDVDIMVFAIRNFLPGFFVWRNDVSGFTELPVQIVSASPPALQDGTVAFWGDVNGDWQTDLILSGANNIGLRIFLRSGIAQFTDTQQHFCPGTTVQTAQVIDFDGDGDNDIFTTRNFPYLRNDGGVFTLLDTSLPQHAGMLRYLNDMDCDGDWDQIWEYFQSTDPGFTVLDVSLQTATGWQTIGVASISFHTITRVRYDTDFDLDGLPDILTHIPRPYIKRNHISSFIYYYYPSVSVYSLYESSMDFNADGRPDLSYCGSFGVRMHSSTVATSNLPPAAPDGVTATRDGSSLLISWNPPADDHTNLEGLRYNIWLGTSPGLCDLISPNSLPDGRLLFDHRGNLGKATSVRLYNLVPGMEYYFAVQAIDNAGKGSAFHAIRFWAPPLYAPAPVINTFPAQDQLVCEVNSTLSWEADYINSGAPNGYRIYLGTDNPPTNILNAVDNGTMTSFNVSLTGYETYYWRVEAYNSQGTGNSPVHSFRTASFLKIPPNNLSNLFIYDMKRHVNANGEVLFLVPKATSMLDTLSVYEMEDSDFILRYAFPGWYRIGSRQSYDWLDYDLDGYADVFVAFSITGYDGTDYFSKLWHATSTGSFVEMPLTTLFDDPTSTDPMAYPFMFIDLNGDNRMDMLRQNVDTSPYYDVFSPNIMLGGEDGMFHEAQITLPTMRALIWDVADYDLDGDPDILCLAVSNSYSLHLWRNDDLVFTEIALPYTYTRNIAKWLDFDSDGWPDIFTRANSNENCLRILHNNNGVFEPLVLNVTTTSDFDNCNWDWADFDNDGDPDLLYSSGNSTKIYRNDNGSLTPFDLGMPGGADSSCRWVDIDNDDQLDIMVSSPNDLTKTVFYKQYSAQMVPVSDPVQEPAVPKLSGYPNPSSGIVYFTLPRAPEVPAEMRVYNLKGQLLRKIGIDAGAKNFGWDGRDEDGRKVAPGIYLVRLHGGKLDMRGKVTILN